VVNPNNPKTQRGCGVDDGVKEERRVGELRPGVAVAEGAGVRVEVRAAVAEGVGVREGVGVEEAVGVRDGVGVAEAIGVRDGVGVFVAVAVGEGIAATASAGSNAGRGQAIDTFDPASANNSAVLRSFKSKA